ATYLAILKLGAAAVPMPLRLTDGAFAAMVELTGCRAFCVDGRRLAKFRAGLPADSIVITPELLNVKAVGGWPETCAIDERSDLAALMFTSGSTGQANAVRITH